MWLGSTNHDEFAFEDPERFYILRNSNGHCSHIGFGYGVHYCIGAPLTRLETRIALRIILERFPNLQISDGDKSNKTERKK
jgi:cytochrome P450